MSGAYLRDLAALLALPRVWQNREPNYIASSLLDVLLSLLRLDATYVQLIDEHDGIVFQDARSAAGLAASDLREALRIPDTPPAEVMATATWSSPNPRRDDARPLRVLRFDARFATERAIVISGTTRHDFPTEVESFLVRMAVEQAILAIRSSRLVRNLQTANTAKATFLATMSHELRTPLNAIIGYSELLDDGIEGTLPDRQKQHIARIGGAARHLLGLIEGILNFARLEAGQEKLHLSDTDAAVLTQDVIALVEPLVNARRLELSARVPGSAMPMHSDAGKVRQILLNLLSNALKFTARGRITVEICPDGDHIVWLVHDTGTGIAADETEAIFEPFRQSGKVHSERAPGTGLGLSVSRQLARLLGGDVTVDSTPGVGSTFTLRLPRTTAS